MVFEFATKRNPSNGYRKYLGIDTDKKVYSRERGHWYVREDIVEIRYSELQRLEKEASNLGYSKIEYFSER